MTESEVKDTGQLDAAFEQGFVNIQGFGDRALMKMIGEQFNLHPPMLED